MMILHNLSTMSTIYQLPIQCLLTCKLAQLETFSWLMELASQFQEIVIDKIAELEMCIEHSEMYSSATGS